MKRMLSVILSLALLASALIIPMSVSAEGTLSPEKAAQAVIDAVNGLDLNINAVGNLLTETAYPVGSQTKGDDGEAYVNKTGNISISDTDNSLPSKIGSKYVNVTGNTANEGGWGLRPSDLHALRYQKSSTVTDKSGTFRLREIGYIVLYVKTNRAFKFGLSVHNNAATPRIADGLDVPATNNDYEAVIVDVLDYDLTKIANGYCSNNVNWGFFPIVMSMAEGEQTITESDGISFGSLFCVPVDTAVRDFKYNINLDSKTVTTRFTSADGVTPEMIVAAEAIDNADGRYTAESFKNLQDAITAAKKAFIDTGDENAVALFKAEAANLYKLEEVFRPKFKGDSTVYQQATEEDIAGLSEYQKTLLGDYYIKIGAADLASSGFSVNFTNAAATGTNHNVGLIDYNDYNNIYFYAVNNTGSLYTLPGLSGIHTQNGSTVIPLYDKNNNGSFKLLSEVTRCDLFDLTVNKGNPYDQNDVRYFVNNYPINSGTSHDEYTGSTRIQFAFSKACISSGSLILGSMMGEKKFDTTGLDAVTNKATLVKYYADNIANQGYENSAAVEETMELLGITTVEVVRKLGNTIGIKYPENTKYTLETAVVGEKVSFSLDTSSLQSGVTVTVKYGDDEITDDDGDGYYEITVAKGKVLYIIPSHVTTEFANADVSKYFDSNDTTTNIARGKTPYVFITNRNVTPATRTLKIEDQWSKISNLSNGDYTTDGGADISLNMEFCTNGTFLNGYVPYKDTVGADFDFAKDAANYQAYVDIIYDLGTTADIYKVQQISNRTDGLQLGLYEVYASKDINDLFDRSKSLVVSYQNKTAKTGSTKTGNEQHEFPTRSARFVAFRVYSSTTYSTANSNTLRTRELAIYGTKTGDYTVSEKLNLPSSNTPLTHEEGAVDLLKDKQATVDYTDNGGTTTSNYNNAIISVLTDGSNKPNSHKDFNCATYQSGTLNNGYTIERNADVNIKFTRDTNTPIGHYTDFTFELNSYYKVTDFGFYHYDASFTDSHKVQAFQVYIGNDKTNLYTEKNLAITCENYFNSSVHEFKFNKTKVGKYIGVRVLMSNLSDNSIRIAEIAAYGKEVGAPDEGSKLAPEIITSKSGYIYNKGGSSVFDYTNSNGETVKGTALRLTVGYKSPKVPGGANASKIVLANGKTANVIERNVIAIAKSKYDALENKDLNIHTAVAAGASVTTSTATSTDHPVSNYFKSETIPDDSNYCMAYGALNINNISETNKDSQIVVIGRVVYEYQGEIYAVYSNIVGNETGKEITAQAAYQKLCENIATANNNDYAKSPYWFNNTKWNGTDFATVG